MTALPMFPLGTTLLPGMVLPLHVFEPRYRALVTDVLAGDGEFGVVLIDRGHEVGGGEHRTDIGAVARVIESEPMEDGRWLLIAVGTRRIRVTRWLEDAPYPRAEVEDHPDADADEEPDTRREVSAALRRVLALRSELGEDVPPATTDLEADPTVASYQAAILSGTSPHDAQRLLEAPDATARFELLRHVLDDAEAVLRFRIGADG